MSTFEAGAEIELSDGARLYVEQHGTSGACLVTIPGWAYTCEVFRPALPHLAQKHRVVMYDPRGHGRSSATSAGHSYTQHGADLAELIQLLCLDNVVLLGWSLGVYDALSYIEANGHEGVAGLILADESPKIVTSDDNRWGEGTEEEVAGLIRLVEDNFLGFFADYMRSGFVEPPAPETVENFTKLASTLTASQAAGLLEDATQCDFRALLSMLNGVLPMLHILREDWSEKAVRWIAQNQSAADHFTLGNHLMLMEYPEQFSKRVLAFLESAVS